MIYSRTFQDLKVWQVAHTFVLNVYKVCKEFPENERFGLVSQFQRAAVSIPANIAEGYKKLGTADKLRFYNIAQGSLEECRYYIILSRDLGYITSETADELQSDLEQASRYLNEYCKAIKDHKVTYKNDEVGGN